MQACRSRRCEPRCQKKRTIDKHSSSKVLNDFSAWAKDNKEARGDQDKAKAAGERLFKCVMDSGVSIDKLQGALKDM
jgi:hypothetical protein